MNKIKQLAGDTVLYGLGSMVPRMLNFLLLPLHTRSMFSTEQYGVITQLYAVVAFLNIVYMFGMETAFFRFATKPGADRQKIYNLSQTCVMIISVLLSATILSFSSPIAASLNVKTQYISWLTYVMLIDAVVAIPFARLRLERKPLLFSLGKIINVSLLIGLNIYFLKFNYDPSIGVGYVFIANLAANAFYLLFLGKYLLQWRPVFDKTFFPALFTYAYPVMLTGLAGMTNEMFSRFMLEWWLPPNFYPGKSNDAAVGIFGAAYKYAVFMSLAVQAFRFAGEPFFFSNASDKNSPTLFAQVNHYFIILCCILLFVVGTNLDLFKHLVGREFWDGLTVVPLLLLAYLFLGVYYNFTVWFKLTDKTYYGTLITVGGALLTITLNYLLIPVAGYVGSSWATLLCYFSMAAACYLLGQKYYPIPYDIQKGLIYIVGTTVAVYLINEWQIPNQWMATATHAILVLLYIFVIYIIERKKLRQMLV